MHERRILVQALEYGGCHDQLNLVNLASMEYIGRRIQAVVDAHSINPQKPNYEVANLFTGQTRARDVVSPGLRSHVARRARDEAEVEKSRQKTRELRGGGKGGGKKNKQEEG